MIRIAKAYSHHSIKVGYTEIRRSIAKAAFQIFNFGDADGAYDLLKDHSLDQEEAQALIQAMQDQFNSAVRTYAVEEGALDEVLS